MTQSEERLLELNAQLAQTLTDKGVEATADETTTALVDKVAEISGGDDFIGVKYLNYSGFTYNLPKTVDARSLDLILREPSELKENGLLSTIQAENDHAMDSLCENISLNANGGYFAQLEEVYLPSKITILSRSFRNCKNLKKIYGDLRNLISLNVTFYNCSSLTELPYMPNLIALGNQSFYGCTGLTTLTLHKVLEMWHTGALTGCTNITTINLAEGWNTAVYAQHCQNLTQECLHDMIEKYADMTGKTSPVMNVGTTNLDKIDDEHKAMATAKNVTLA